MGMLLSAFLKLCRRWSRNADDTGMYSNYDIGSSAQVACDDWNRVTHAARTATTLTLTAGSNVMPAMPDDWLPEQHLQSEVTLAGSLIFPELNWTSYETVLNAYATQTYGVIGPFLTVQSGNNMGKPCLIGYKTRTEGIVYPIPDQAYTVQEWYWTQFTDFAPGTALLNATLNGLGGVQAISVSNGGTYFSTPVLTIAGGTGSGATATVVMSTSNTSLVASITMTATGSGYTNLTLTLSGDNALDRSLNLPDDHLRVIARFGAPSILHFTEPENTEFVKELEGKFQLSAKQFQARAAGGRGPRVAYIDKGTTSNYPRQIWVPQPNVP